MVIHILCPTTWSAISVWPNKPRFTLFCRKIRFLLIYALLDVKFWLKKFGPCKKSDKYEVWLACVFCSLSCLCCCLFPFVSCHVCLAFCLCQVSYLKCLVSFLLSYVFSLLSFFFYLLSIVFSLLSFVFYLLPIVLSCVFCILSIFASFVLESLYFYRSRFDCISLRD